MTELELLLNDIEDLKKILIELVEQKKDLQDPDVIAASQNLNKVIVKYSKLISDKMKK